MARKIDTTKAKERKQKIFVAVGGVLFLGIAAIQGPKMYKLVHPSTPAPAPAAAAAPASASTTASTSLGSTPAGTTSLRVHTAQAPAGQTAQLAGIVVVPEQPVEPDTGQLESFSKFTAKDPFVPQIKEAATDSTVPASPTATKAATPTPKPATPATGDASTTPGAGLTGGATAPMPLPAPTAAILRVNGVLQAVELKDAFPKSDKTFLLASLERGGAKIGVAAGGRYTTGSKTLTLKVGKRVTLLNTATGVRYVIKLVYVGADAAQLTAFTTAAPATAPAKTK